MRVIYFAVLLCFIAACNSSSYKKSKSSNPFLTELNVPIDYAKVSAADVEAYARLTLNEAVKDLAAIKAQQQPTFANVFVAMDDINNKMDIASNNCYMLYWVSPDSVTRVNGLDGYNLLDSFSTVMGADKDLFNKMLAFQRSTPYKELTGNKKVLVDDMIADLERSGVHLNEQDLSKFKTLTQDINDLSSDFSTNMNTSEDVLTLDEAGMQGLPESFKAKYKTAANKYNIPIINATSETVMENADLESTRKAYKLKFSNRAADKNMVILDSMVKKRHELAVVMGSASYAAYSLEDNMARDPATVWTFISGLVQRAKATAVKDVALLEAFKKTESGNNAGNKLQPWDIGYYTNQLKKKQYKVDEEKTREYLPMERCLKGMFDIYQELLGLQFKKVANPSVWHKDVDMYEVYEGDKLKGRFYLDLFPRPNKESWFYGVTLSPGKATAKGYEVPVAMLLGNFTSPTKAQPSLLSFSELNTLFHEFGHIVNAMSYEGEFSYQAESKDDFGEAMSQIFENWIWDYDILSSFAKHFKTGESLPKQDFDNMLKTKNLSSGFNAIGSLRRCLYDMNLYDKYNAAAPVSTDKLWQDIDKDLGVMPLYIPGTHPQASWIHINTNPVYYYGYLWSEVYAQDMFTEFKKNGLRDSKTGIRYRKLILANGTQRDIVKAVEEFLGRPSNNEAYIKSLGLD